MKKIILIALLSTTLTSTSVLAMESCKDLEEGDWKKTLINPPHDSTKSDTIKKIASPEDSCYSPKSTVNFSINGGLRPTQQENKGKRIILTAKKKKNEEKQTILTTPHYNLSKLGPYKDGKIDIAKEIHQKNKSWTPEREFLYPDEDQYITRDILFARLDQRDDGTFDRNGKLLQIIGIMPLEKDFPDGVLVGTPFKTSQKKGWCFREISIIKEPIYFEIIEVQGQKRPMNENPVELSSDDSNELMKEIAELEKLLKGMDL